MTSFRDYDAATFRAVHAQDAVSIFPTGERFEGIEGIEAIMSALDAHFTERQALRSGPRSIGGSTAAARRSSSTRRTLLELRLPE